MQFTQWIAALAIRRRCVGDRLGLHSKIRVGMTYRILALMAAVFLGASPMASATVQYVGKTIYYIELDTTSSCYVFQLVGVSEADPVVPKGPFFAISTTAPNAKEMAAALLVTRATDAPPDKGAHEWASPLRLRSGLHYRFLNRDGSVAAPAAGPIAAMAPGIY
jgi:hypothetical protein